MHAKPRMHVPCSLTRLAPRVRKPQRVRTDGVCHGVCGMVPGGQGRRAIGAHCRWHRRGLPSASACWVRWRPFQGLYLSVCRCISHSLWLSHSRSLSCARVRVCVRMLSLALLLSLVSLSPQPCRPQDKFEKEYQREEEESGAADGGRDQMSHPSPHGSPFQSPR